MNNLSKDYLEYPNRQYGQDHDFYEWRLSKDRPRVQWDGGAKVAICLIVPLEFFPLNPSGTPFKHPGAMVTPYPDLRHFTVRDYGNRVGVFRVLEALNSANAKATFALNSEVERRYGTIQDFLHDHEIARHGISTDHIHYEGMADEEKLFQQVDFCKPAYARLISEIPSDRIIFLKGDHSNKPKIGDIGELDQAHSSPDGRDLITTYFDSVDGKSEWQIDLYEDEFENYSNQIGWLSPGRNQSSQTLSLLPKFGYTYCLDWEMDQVPVTAKTKNGEITLIPNSYELSDFTLLHTRRQTEESWLKQIMNAIDLLASEYDRYGSQMLGLTLTPYIIGQPFRIWALRELLTHINDRDDVSIFTAGDIERQFRTQTK